MESRFRKAAELIERDGWVSQAWRSGESRCILQSVRDAGLGRSNWVVTELDKALSRYVSYRVIKFFHKYEIFVSMTPGIEGVIISWNDFPFFCGSKRKVIKALKRAAKNHEKTYKKPDNKGIVFKNCTMGSATRIAELEEQKAKLTYEVFELRIKIQHLEARVVALEEASARTDLYAELDQKWAELQEVEKALA